MSRFEPNTALYGRRVAADCPGGGFVAFGTVLAITSPHRWVIQQARDGEVITVEVPELDCIDLDCETVDNGRLIMLYDAAPVK